MIELTSSRTYLSSRASRRRVLALTVGMCAAAAGARAAEYPSRAIKIVVPFPPGGPVDAMARIVGLKLAERWREQVVVENMAGANGIIGTEVVAKAPADGYTLLLVPVGHAMNASVYSKLPYDTIHDFTAIANVASAPFVLVVHPSVPAKSIAELIAYAKANPGKLSYGSAGVGSANHLAGAMFQNLARVDIVHVAYKGSTPATNDLLGGHVSMIFNNMVNSVPFIERGQLRALAVTGTERSPAVPDLPTIAESGLSGFDVTGWYGMFGPAGIPGDIVGKLNLEINRVIALADVRQRLQAQGVAPAGGSADAFAAFVRSEVEKWRAVAKAAGAKAD